MPVIIYRLLPKDRRGATAIEVGLVALTLIGSLGTRLRHRFSVPARP